MDRSRLSSRMVLLFAIALAAGCGGPAPTPTGTVSGRVTFAGKAVSEGTVNFYNVKTGFPAEFALDAEGAYASNPKAPLPVGDYAVMVSPLSHLVDNDPGKTPPALVEKVAPNIPMKYRRQATSPLKATVTAGANEHNFTLTP